MRGLHPDTGRSNRVQEAVARAVFVGCSRRRTADRRAGGARRSQLTEASSPKPGTSDQTEFDTPDAQDSDEASQARWPGRRCKFRAAAHWPHRSGNDASGHGNWVNTSNPASRCPDRAYVTVHLQAYGCLQVFPYTCHWHTQSSRTRHVRSRDQVPLHVPCDLTEPGKWWTYTVVRVPISWWFDKHANKTSDEKWLNCRPHNLG